MSALLRVFWFCVGFSLLFSSVSKAAQFTEVRGIQKRLKALQLIYQADGFGPSPKSGPRSVFGLFGHFDDFRVIEMSGKITKGDKQRFDQAIRDGAEGRPPQVYLLLGDSPGGSFAAANELGREIFRTFKEDPDPPLVGVVALKGYKCLSACAFIGAWAGNKLYVEPGAELGFHWPYLPASKFKQLSKSESSIAGAMDVAYDVALSFSELALSGAVGADLVREAFQRRGPEAFWVPETAEDIWRAGFTPVGPSEFSRAITVENMRLEKIAEICRLRYLRYRDKPRHKEAYVGEEYFFHEHSQVRLRSALSQLDTNWMNLMSSLTDQEMENGVFCTFGLDQNNHLHVAISNGKRPCVTKVRGAYNMICTAPAPKFASYVSITVLKELAK